MDRVPDFLKRRPRSSAMALGLVAAAGFQPLHLWPLTLLAMGALVWLVHRQVGGRAAFVIGWLFGLAHFTLTNNWIATAFNYQSEMPAALGWAAVPLLSLYLAVWPGFAALAAHLLAGRRALPVFALAFGACWIAAEWLRSWVFTGYAWGPLSMALLGDWGSQGWARVLPVMGTYAASGVFIGFSGLAAWMLERKRWISLIITLVIFGIGMLWPAERSGAGTLPVTLVQPNLKQNELDDPSKFEEQFQRIAKLSEPQGKANRRLVLWPESGVPDYLREGYPKRYYMQTTAGGDPAFARYRIGKTIGEGSLLLTGAVDLEIAQVAGEYRAVGAYNAITPIDARGNLGQRYAKAHLVPYGEYLPMRALLEPLGLSRLVAGSIDFIPGPGPRTLDFGMWGKAGMQICYEIVFSGEVVDRSARPDYIFNPSNDGWFGEWGPPQHLAQARMRALEEGLPVLRATTTGISAIIDARGIVRRSIARGEAARIDALVPPPAAPTLFSRFGHWLTLFWAIALLVASLVASRVLSRYEKPNI